jgi:hypothetical protein
VCVCICIHINPAEELLNHFFFTASFHLIFHLLLTRNCSLSSCDFAIWLKLLAEDGWMEMTKGQSDNSNANDVLMVLLLKVQRNAFVLLIGSSSEFLIQSSSNGIAN